MKENFVQPLGMSFKPIKRCKEEDQREKSIMKQFCMLMRNLHMLCEIQRTEVARQIWSTLWSPILTCYISFWSSRSQESNALNGVQFGAKMRKLWPIEGDCAKLRRNLALTFPDAKISALTSHWHFSMWKFSQHTFPMWKFSHWLSPMQNLSHHLSPIRKCNS